MFAAENQKSLAYFSSFSTLAYFLANIKLNIVIKLLMIMLK